MFYLNTSTLFNIYYKVSNTWLKLKEIIDTSVLKRKWKVQHPCSHAWLVPAYVILYSHQHRKVFRLFVNWSCCSCGKVCFVVIIKIPVIWMIFFRPAGYFPLFIDNLMSIKIIQTSNLKDPASIYHPARTSTLDFENQHLIEINEPKVLEKVQQCSEEPFGRFI